MNRKLCKAIIPLFISICMLIISIKADQGYQKNNDRAITVMNNNDTEDDAEKNKK